MFAVCPQNCFSISFIGIWVVAHTSPPDVHIGVFSSFKMSAQIRAFLCEGVTLRELPDHRRWLEPLLAGSLSTGAGLKTACVQLTEHSGV